MSGFHFMKLYTGGSLHDKHEPVVDIIWEREFLERLHDRDPDALKSFLNIVVIQNQIDPRRTPDD